VVNYYVRILSNLDALRGCFGLYRAWDTTLAQNEKRTTRPLTMPVLAIGGAASWGDAVGHVAANDVETVVIPGTGHWVAETAPEEMLAALTAFLAPYRDGEGAAQRPHAAAVR
jgi:pimeloyl-ACP methyl ester carboxylesterase